MSNVEIAKASPIYAGTFAAMVSGVSPSLTLPLTSFFPGVSRILGIKGVTLGTVASFQNGQVKVTLPSAAATACTAILYSASASDTSVYQIYWTNETLGSASSILPC